MHVRRGPQALLRPLADKVGQTLPSILQRCAADQAVLQRFYELSNSGRVRLRDAGSALSALYVNIVVSMKV
jgi:hypothetical protein